jgi:hypothetical protein
MKRRILTAAIAALFMLSLFCGAAVAAEPESAPEDIPTEQTPALVMETPALEVPATEYPDEPASFTPSGTGTVIDRATDADGKEFYTIMTPSENVFYLVIDRVRGNENVYFLNAVTEADLFALAETPQTPGAVNPPAAAEQPPAPIEPPIAETTPEPEQGGGNTGMLFLLAAVVLLGGGAGWYFKSYRPKRQKAETEGETDYSPDGGEPYAADADDDFFPWDDGGTAEYDGDGDE